MKTKKLLSVLFLFSLVVGFVSVAPNINAMQIPEGAIIKTEHNPDVYIVKYKNGKQFKRLVLNPQVFESYGHLRWENILTVSQSKMNSFTESTLVRSDGESNVYKLVANGDLGNKALVETGYTYDLDSVYTINNIDSGNYVLKKLEELAGIIDELQKQIDDIKTEISTPKVDFCNNIEGDQTYIPVGMYRENGNCFAEVIATDPEPISQVDFCNNVEGLQTYIPPGIYRENGNCFTDVITPEPDPEPELTTLTFKNVQDMPGKNYFSIKNNGPDIIRIKKLNFKYFSPIHYIKIDRTYYPSSATYKANYYTDQVTLNVFDCEGLGSLGYQGKYSDGKLIDICERRYSQWNSGPILAKNEIGVNETIIFEYSDYTNYGLNYDQGVLIDKGSQQIIYTNGSIIEVSTGNNVLFEDFNL